jgi:hypothetical protein
MGREPSLSKEQIYSAAIEMWMLFLTWNPANSAEAGLAATERLVTKWPEVEGSRELAARLWPRREDTALPRRHSVHAVEL